MSNPVVHFEVVGRDANLLQNYYSELFGWEIDHNNSRGYGLVKPTGEGGIAGGIGGGHVPGYEVVKSVFLGQFRDPEGHLIGVMT